MKESNSMSIGDVYRASILFNGTEADNPMIMTLHYQTNQISVPGTPADEAQEIAEGVSDIIVADYPPLMSNTLSYERTNVIGITEPTAQGSKVDITVGQSVTGVSSWRVAPVISWKSGLRGRSYNGRVFAMAPPEDNVGSGSLGGPYQTALFNLANNLATVTLANGNEYIVGTWSRKLQIFTQSSGIIVRATVGTQKSRQKVT